MLFELFAAEGAGEKSTVIFKAFELDNEGAGQGRGNKDQISDSGSCEKRPARAMRFTIEAGNSGPLPARIEMPWQG